MVVADWRCDWIGLGVAQQLAQQGHKVTLAVDGYMAGQRIQQYVRDEMTKEALLAGVEIVPLVRLIGADADSVYLQHVLTDEPVIVDDVAALVLSQGHDSVTELADALTDVPRRGARHRRLPGSAHRRGGRPRGPPGGVRPLKAGGHAARTPAQWCATHSFRPHRSPRMRGAHHSPRRLTRVDG